MGDLGTIKVLFESVREGAKATLSGGGGGKGGAGRGLMGILGKMLKGLGPLGVLLSLKPISDALNILTYFVGFGLFKVIKWIFGGIEALINFDWKTLFASIWQRILEMFPWLQKVIDAVVIVKDWIMKVWNLAKAFFNDPIGVIKQGMMMLWEKLVEWMPWLQTIATWIKEKFDILWGGVKGFFKDPVGKIKKGFSSALTWLKDKLGPPIKKIKEFIEDLKDNAKTKFSELINNIKSFWTGVKEKFISLIDWVKGLPAAIWDFLKELPGLIAQLLPGGGGSDDSMTDGVVANGRVYKTHPDDTIIATKNPGSLGGGGSTFNFYGVTSDEMLNVIKRELAEDINIAGRF